MLTEMDDTLWHQLPTTFDHVHTSDPRFYDRYWFAAYDPRGKYALQLTVGAYNNMNVMDAGFIFVDQGRQYNLRSSRELRPEFRSVCGPIEVEAVQPLHEFNLTVNAGAHPAHGELTWTGSASPVEESPHFDRSRGRVQQHTRRFNQLGSASGWIVVNDKRIHLENWWACRDHSWGVRPNMGIREPQTGPKVALSEEGYFMVFLFGSTGALAGTVHVNERGSKRRYETGHFSLHGTDRTGEIDITDVEVRPEFRAGTRRFTRIVLRVVADQTEEFTIECVARGSSVAMPGLGYSGGFRDGKGLGVWRGADHVEFEDWDVQHPVDVVDPLAGVLRPWHRIQPVSLTVRGAGLDSVGTGSLTAIASGHLPQYGLPRG